MRRTRAWIASAGCGLLLLTGCTSGSKPTAPSSTAAAPTTATPTTTAPSAAPSATPTPTPTRAPAKPRARRVDPLTGLPVRVVARRPVLVVKIENSAAARPQTGLNTADIVLEELVEGGITRFAAMYHSTLPPTTLGPVRSLRDVDRAIAGPTGGLLVASGGAGVVRARVGRGGAQLVLPVAAGRYFRRSGARVAPHNLYVNGRAALHAARGRHRTPPKTTYLQFATSVARSSAVRYGHRTRRINLIFSPVANPRWTYNPRARNWLRYEGGTPSRLTSGKRITARTIVVVRVHTRDAGYRDPAGNFVPRTVFVGHGNATVFCQGRRISARWTKRSPAAQLKLVTRYGGKPVLIAPGRTWIEMLPTSGTLRVG